MTYSINKNSFTIRSTLIALSIALSACGSVLTPKPTEVSLTTQLYTQTFTLTETKTPTVTISPTETMTPTETTIPVPDYYHGLAPSLEDFTMVKAEDEAVIMADIMAHPELTQPPLNIHGIIQRLQWGAYYGATIGCSYGIDCVIRASFKENTYPLDGHDRWKIVWEICTPDGMVKEFFGRYIVCSPGESHKYILGYIGGTGGGDFVIEQDAYTELHILQRSKYAHINIITKIKTELDDKWNPIAIDLTNNAPEQAQIAFSELTETLIISDVFSHITVYLEYG